MAIPKKVERLILNIASRTDNPMDFAMAILHERRLIRWRLSRLSKADKVNLIATSKPGLHNAMDIFLYSRMSGLLQSGKTIRMHEVLSEASKFFQCSITLSLKIKAYRVREIVYQERKYKKRKMQAVLET